MTYGYARISTKQQSIDRQIRNIKAEYPNAVIMQEAYTGTKIDRPVFDKMLKKLQPKDTVVFDSVSRMSRNAQDGFALYQDLYKKDINLVFLKEHHIDTDTYKSALANRLSMTGDDTDLILQGINAYLLRLAEKQIQLAFGQAQKEVDDLHQRTKEGIQTARINGKQIGQKEGAKLKIKKEAPAKAIILQHSKCFGGSLNDIECMKLTGLARNTYYKYKRELKEAQ